MLHHHTSKEWLFMILPIFFIDLRGFEFENYLNEDNEPNIDEDMSFDEKSDGDEDDYDDPSRTSMVAFNPSRFLT